MPARAYKARCSARMPGEFESPLASIRSSSIVTLPWVERNPSNKFSIPGSPASSRCRVLRTSEDFELGAFVLQPLSHDRTAKRNNHAGSSTDKA